MSLHQQTVSQNPLAPWRNRGAQPDSPESPDLLGLLRQMDRQAGRAEQAIGDIAHLIEANATNPDFFFNLGRELAGRGRHALAADHFRRALEIRPSMLAARLALAVQLRRLGEFDQAENCCRQALEHDPGFASAQLESARLRHAQGDVNGAVQRLRRACQSDACADASFLLGRILHEQGDLRAAMDCFLDGLKRRPEDDEARLAAGLIALAIGDFQRGWRDYEARLSLRDSLSNCAPLRLDEQTLQRQTVLVRSEGCLTDDIMFASCFHELIDRTAGCRIECDARLAALFRRSFPAAEIVASPASQGGNGSDAEVFAGSLPGVFRKDVERFPDRRGYLVADPQLRQSWMERLRHLPPGLKVGVSLGGAARGPGLEDWAPLLTTPDVHFISLDGIRRGRRLAQMASQANASVSVADVRPRQQADELAALLTTLDLVICVPNLTAHLAGGLGVPTWTVLNSWPSWRWMLEGQRNPWYPAMRLFRQSGENWDDLFATLKAELMDVRVWQLN